MKSIVMPENVQFGEDSQMDNEVKETLAKGAIVLSSKRNFTAAEMWRRNKQRRSATEMLRKWN